MSSPGTRDGEEASTLEAVRALVRQGAELYNDGAFWDAHEAWEEGWHHLRDAGLQDEADLLQGLILATAGFENLRRGKPAGFRVQGAKALQRLREHPDLGARLGLADQRAFTRALLEVYLAVQRRGVEALEPVRGRVPVLDVDA